MVRRPPKSTRTSTLRPYTPPFRSLRREIMGGIDDGAHRGVVRRNENGPSPGRTCEVGGEPRQESGGSTGQRHRLVGRKDFLEVGHLAGVLDIVDGLELLHHRAVP